MLIAVSLIWLAIASALLVRGVDPVPVTFYLLAWYPTLLLFDQLARRTGGRAVSASAALSVWLWSAPIWLFFEAANLRLENWYYVFVPRVVWQRWMAMGLAFATVVPALFLAERLLDTWGLGKKWRARPFEVTPLGLRAILALGGLMLGLALAWPGIFFPYIWGAMWLICEPYVYWRRPDLSLFADLERGDWGRVGRLAAGGAVIGLLWEALNFWARAKWIYTVPGLEIFKLWEMPLLGFLGFPFFALEAWAMYHALCAAGVAVPLTGPARIKAPQTAIAGIITFGLSVLALRGLDRFTVRSVAPYLDDIPALTTADRAALRAQGLDLFKLAHTGPDRVRSVLGSNPAFADSLVETARLMTLRGIGVARAHDLRLYGIWSVCDLAGQDPDVIWNTLRTFPSESGLGPPSRAEVRIWHQAAKAECARS